MPVMNYRQHAGPMPDMGLKNNFYQTVFVPLLQARNHDGEDKRIGKDLGIEDMMERLGLKNSAGEPLTWPDLWQMMGMDPRVTTLQNIIDRPDDFRFLAGEIIREFIVEGYQEFQQFAWYRYFCVSADDRVGAMTVHQPKLGFVDAEPKQVGEAETLPLSRITFGDKSIRLTTKGTFCEWTDQIKYSSPIGLMKPYFAEVAAIIVAQENDHCIWTLINGDQAILGSSSDSAAVIGVSDTTKGSQYVDHLTMWARGSALHMFYDAVITSEAGGVTLKMIDEFKPSANGAAPVVQVDSMNAVDPKQVAHCVSGLMTDTTRLWIDRRRAARQLVLWPTKVEQTRYPEKLVEGVAISACTGYESINRKARLIMDEEQDIDDAPFPSWMAAPGALFKLPA